MNFNVITLYKQVIPALSGVSREAIEEHVNKAFSNVIAKCQGDILHIQYMGHRFEYRGSSNSLEAIRQAMGRGKYANRNSAVSVNLETHEILHQFGPKAITFGNWEAYQAPYIIFHELLKYYRLEDQQVIKVLRMPVGLIMQLCWVATSGKWVVSSRSYCNINENTFGSSVSVWDVFECHLAKAGLSADDLNKDRLYTFLLSDSRWNQGVSDKLYLMSIFDRVNKSAVTDDKIKTSKLPRLLSRRYSVQECFSKGQLVGILRKQYQYINQYKEMYSLVLLAPDGTYYEIETDTANELHERMRLQGHTA